MSVEQKRREINCLRLSTFLKINHRRRLHFITSKQIINAN